MGRRRRADPSDAATLRTAVTHLAAAALLARHWPGVGQRHEAALAAAGLLLRGGLDRVDVERIVTEAARAAGDDEAQDRRRNVPTTDDRLRIGQPVTGGRTLAECLRGNGEKVVTALRTWLGLLTPLGAEPCTDVTNAARFVAQHGLDFRYCYQWKTWLRYDGQVWRRDAGDAVMRAAKVTARTWFTSAGQATTEDQRQALVKWAIYANSEPGLRRMLLVARSELAIPPQQFDADPWLLNCPNGTLELRTQHLRPHRHEDYCTKIAAAPYDPDANSDVWNTFLEAALPEEVARTYAQRYAGYSLTGSTREEVFVFVRGPAGGGKSTYTEALRATWGDYATAASFTSFLVQGHEGPREDLARLAGARLVISVETRDGQRLAEGLVKLLTGGDMVTARRLYENSFEFLPQFKLLLASNYRPKASAEDDGLWRRLRELPFPVSRPKRDDRDVTIKATLTDPAQCGAAILAWAVKGCQDWLEHGLEEPDVVMQATAAYRGSQEPLADFVEDRCTLDKELSVDTDVLRSNYEDWCREVGIKKPVSGRRWGAALRALGCTPCRTNVQRLWKGIGITPPDAIGPPSDGDAIGKPVTE